jgi:hypothetical protein
VVWFAPNEKHWHGATPRTAMTHITIQEVLNGKVVDWMEDVTARAVSEKLMVDGWELRAAVSLR